MSTSAPAGAPAAPVAAGSQSQTSVNSATATTKFSDPGQSAGSGPAQSQQAQPSRMSGLSSMSELGRAFDDIVGPLAPLDNGAFRTAEGQPDFQAYENARVARDKHMALRQGLRDLIMNGHTHDGLGLQPFNSESQVRDFVSFADNILKGNADASTLMSLYRMQELLDAARADGTRSAANSMTDIAASQMGALSSEGTPARAETPQRPPMPQRENYDPSELVDYDPNSVRRRRLGRTVLLGDKNAALAKIHPDLPRMVEEDPQALLKTPRELGLLG